VLIRPKLLSLHGLTEAEVESILTDLALNAIVLNAEPKLAPAAPDPGDQLLWDLLAARPDLVLITGDKRLLQDAGMRGRVITPREFVQQA
jgi:predicted nucleic acid-binding protein